MIPVKWYYFLILQAELFQTDKANSKRNECIIVKEAAIVTVVVPLKQ
jgi:hypothetical protein